MECSLLTCEAWLEAFVRHNVDAVRFGAQVVLASKLRSDALAARMRANGAHATAYREFTTSLRSGTCDERYMSYPPTARSYT